MPVATTHNVEVSVEAAYLEEQSDESGTLYSFSYHVRLKNNGAEPVQLISRHWIITDSTGDVREVNGIGVVGEQPILEPGGDFEYTSGSQLHSPLGTMEGTYRMHTEGGDSFEVRIPLFTLSVPGSLN